MTTPLKKTRSLRAEHFAGAQHIHVYVNGRPVSHVYEVDIEVGYVRRYTLPISRDVDGKRRTETVRGRVELRPNAALSRETRTALQIALENG